MNWQFFHGKRVLITGGNGYIATNLIQSLSQVECLIRRFDRKGTVWNTPDVADGIVIESIDGEIDDPQTVSDVTEGIDVVYHFAAQTSVNKSNADPRADLDANVVPIVRVLEACRMTGKMPVVILAGTVTERGIAQELPVNENQADDPVTIYDLHKLIAETYLKYYVRREFIQGCVLRLSNVYGPGPKSSSADRGVLNQMVLRAINGKELTVYGTGDFLRDYVHISDVTSAFLKCAERMTALNGETCVISSGKGYRFKDVIQLVADRVFLKTGCHVPIRYTEPATPLSPIDLRNFVGDSSKFRQLAEWVPTVDLQVGLDMMIDWFLKKQNDAFSGEPGAGDRGISGT